MAWPLGIVLGILLFVLTFTVVPFLLEAAQISEKYQSSLHASTLVVLVMLCVILLRQQRSSPRRRIIRPRGPEEAEK